MTFAWVVGVALLSTQFLHCDSCQVSKRVPFKDSADLAQSALIRAGAIAIDLRHRRITPFHLAAAIIDDELSLGSIILRDAGANIEELGNALVYVLSRLLPDANSNLEGPSPSASLIDVLQRADLFAKELGEDYVGIRHIVPSLTVDRLMKKLLESCGATKQALRNSAMALQLDNEGNPTSSRKEVSMKQLDRFGDDLVKRAREKKLDPVIGRQKEIQRVINILSRKTKNNPVLIGEAGVGKTAVVEAIAQRIADDDVPKPLKGRHLIAIDMGAMIAGTSHRGEFEARLKGVVDEAKASNGSVILFFDELHVVLGAGRAEGAIDAGNLLKPFLARGEIRCIGATTFEDYKKYVEKDAAFERRFQAVDVNEPTVNETISILRVLKPRFEVYHNLIITDAALVAAATLSARYLTGRKLPDKAIDLVDEACAGMRVQLDTKPQEIDELERSIRQLQVEAETISSETTRKSQDRYEQCKRSIEEMKQALQVLQKRFSSEKGKIHAESQLLKQIQAVQKKIENAHLTLSKKEVSRLKGYELPSLKKALKTAKHSATIEPHLAKSLVSNVVIPDCIAAVVTRWTGIPVERLTEAESAKYLHLKERLETRIVGQTKAIEAVSDVILRSRAGISRPDQPLGSFLFLGPTGVGKTELAKALTIELFDSLKNLVRIDMSEYMESHSTSKLIGTAPGYIGYEDSGQLTDAIKRNPYSVILFDEVEKAHPKVVHILLQLLDDGRLTDGHGKTIDFTNTVVILTSNLGSKHLRGLENATAEEQEEAKHAVLQESRSHFPPEFLNRLDDIVVFQGLKRHDLRWVLRIQMEELSKRLGDRSISVKFSKEAADRVLDAAYDFQYGARPLKRYLEKHIVTRLGRLLLKGKIKDHSSVLVDTGDKQFHFYKMEKGTSKSELLDT